MPTRWAERMDHGADAENWSNLRPSIDERGGVASRPADLRPADIRPLRFCVPILTKTQAFRQQQHLAMTTRRSRPSPADTGHTAPAPASVPAPWELCAEQKVLWPQRPLLIGPVDFSTSGEHPTLTFQHHPTQRHSHHSPTVSFPKHI